ncbi:MAG: ATP-binding cassette domain-containing protein [Erythrobacter sp.]
MQLSIRDIGLSYGNRPVLNDVNFSLETRGCALLLGPSGSGKSTLLNIICGLQTPDTGEVALGEYPIASATQKVRPDTIRKRHMGIIFQTLRLVSALSVRGNLLLAQRVQMGAVDAPLVDTTLERLGMSDRAKARPFELSQGEAQRAAIARAVVVKPAMLIADEPTSALDHENTRIVARLLIEAAEEAGASLLIATHDDRLSPYFERTVNLTDGRLTA